MTGGALQVKFWPMRVTLRPYTLLTGSALLATACERSKAPAARDTTAAIVATAPDTTARVPEPLSWDSTDGGPVMVVRFVGTTAPTSAARVVFPQYTDSALPDTVRFSDNPLSKRILDLFDRRGKVGEATLEKMQPHQWAGPGCTEWPTATLLSRGKAPRAPLPAWSLALLGGHAEGVPLDSIEGLSRTDSARLAAEATRLASTLPDDTIAAFRGIPFAVRTAYRFAAVKTVDALIADVVRKVNQEASPLEQHTLIVAERPHADSAARYTTVYSERSSGSEEGVESTELLAALSLGSPPRTVLVLSRLGDETGAFALLERNDGRWRLRWTSVHTGC